MSNYNFKNKYVLQSKALARGLGELSLTQQRILDLLTSNFMADKNDPENKDFAIPFAEIVNYLGLNGGKGYRELRKNMNLLLKASFFCFDDKTKRYHSMPIFNSIVLDEKNMIYYYTFSNSFLFHIVF